MQQKSKKLRPVLFALVMASFYLGAATPAKAGVVFEDNFDNYIWESAPAPAPDVDYWKNYSGSMPFGLTRDTTKPGWYKYRGSSQANLVGDPEFAVTAEVKHGANGKSLKYEIENTYADWNGGGMTLYLGGPDNSKSGEKELYISMWVKFEDTFVIPNVNKGFLMKIMRIILGANADLDTSLSSGNFNGKHNIEIIPKYGGNGYIYYLIEAEPDYRGTYPSAWSYVGRANAPAFTNPTQWKRYMFHIKLNTYDPQTTPIGGDATTEYNIYPCSGVAGNPVAECPAGSLLQVFKYTGVGTNPNITSNNPKAGTSVMITGSNLNAVNKNSFPIMKSGTNYFLVQIHNDVTPVQQLGATGVTIKPVDGLLELFDGDTLVASLPNVSLVSPIEGPIENNKINAITLPDNYFQVALGMSANSEVAWYMDDLVISTNYVPLDYVPGGGTFSPTDVNQDGKVNIQDIQICVKVITGALANSRADVNGDGTVNMKDLQIIVRAIGG